MTTLKTIFKACNTSNYRACNSRTIKYIVIHYTANNGDTAQGNANYFASHKNLKASAHYFVDENEVYQSVKDNDIAWHCGADTSYKHIDCRNANAIGIEICSRKNADGYYFKDEAIANAVELTKHLMGKYNIPISKVLRHYDVTGKNCPAPFVRDNNQWVAFKERLESDTVPEWMKKIMTDAKAIGLITSDHDPNEPAKKWFVLAVALSAIKIIKGGK